MDCLAQSILGQGENQGASEHQQCAQTCAGAHLGTVGSSGRRVTLGVCIQHGQDAEMVWSAGEGRACWFCGLLDQLWKGSVALVPHPVAVAGR